VLGIGVVVATFAFVLPKIADYRQVWDVVKDLSWWQVALLLGATVLNLVTYPPPLQAALPGIHFRQAFVVTQASTASTYIAPGGAAVGMALSFGMLRGWGFASSSVTLAVTLQGIWNQFAQLGFPLVALALLTLLDERNSLLQTVAVVGAVIFLVAAGSFAAGLSTANLARRVGDRAAHLMTWIRRCLRKQPVTWTGERFVRFRAEAIDLLRKRWHWLTLATLAGQLTVFVLLVVCLRVFGVSREDVNIVEAFAAWSLARLLGAIPLTPGGVGFVEVGLTTALVGFGGSNAEVVAAVLVYRFLTSIPTLVLGLVAGATWRRHNPSAAAAEAAMEHEVLEREGLADS
jgi:uncharacterized protein (TIRG00374 family)